MRASRFGAVLSFDSSWALTIGSALLLSIGCVSPTAPPDPSPPSQDPPAASPESASPEPATPFRSEHATLRDDFIQVEVKIPSAPRGPKPTLITPFGPEDAWLARGFVIVRYRAQWSKLAALQNSQPEPQAAAPATPAEDQSVGAWILRSPRPGIIGRAYFGFVRFDAELVGDVIDYLETLPDVDPDRIGISGSSTTGFSALEALGLEPRLAAGVIRVACGDYHTFLRDSSLALAGDPRWLRDGALVLDEDYEAELLDREPIQHADRYPARPLLMQNGEGDTAIPFACATRTAEVFAAAYAAAGVPKRFQFRPYPGLGHNLAPETLMEAMAFFETWLTSTDTPPATPEPSVGNPAR